MGWSRSWFWFSFGMMWVWLWSASHAEAGAKLSVVGQGTETTIKSSDYTYTPNGTGYGGGILLGVGSEKHQLEIGALYGKRRVGTDLVISQLKTVIQIDITSIQAPVLYRRWFGKVFSMGLGGYYTKNQSADVTAFLGRAPQAKVKYSSPLSSSDYGAMASVALRLPLSHRMGFLIDGRYGYGLKKDKTQDIIGLAGLTWDLGKDEKK